MARKIVTLLRQAHGWPHKQRESHEVCAGPSRQAAIAVRLSKNPAKRASGLSCGFKAAKDRG
jgi:hypothetical protein